MANGKPPEMIRRDLEHFWDLRLQRARERYFQAAAECHRHMAGQSGQPVENPGSTACVRRAEAEAFANYCRVLATFTEVVTIGKLPPPERPNVVVMPRGPE
jgi:hypothetical protein